MSQPGHEVKLMPPQLVRAAETNKNDDRDAEAICEAVARPASAAQPPGSFAARTSTISIFGASASRRGASAMSALAISPARCACRPESAANASNIANAAGPSRKANQTG